MRGTGFAIIRTGTQGGQNYEVPDLVPAGSGYDVTTLIRHRL